MQFREDAVQAVIVYTVYDNDFWSSKYLVKPCAWGTVNSLSKLQLVYIHFIFILIAE